MKYLKIQNKGILPISLFFLMGASTKDDDPSKIGEFGTGLKYAVSYFMRNNINLKVFIGVKELKFEIKEKKVRKKVFNCIYINGKNSNLTTKFGDNWEAWMAIREVWCNAIDEGKPSMEEVEQGDVDTKYGKPAHTTFLIEISDKIEKVIDSWDDHFLTRDDVLFENEEIAIYPSLDKNLKIYKNGILIYTEDKKCIFHYDLKRAKINELRELKSSSDDVVPHMLTSTKEVISILTDKLNTYYRNDKEYPLFENDLSYRIWYYQDGQKEKIHELFVGKLYISRRSSNDSKHGIMLNDSLTTTLKECGLKTLEVHYSSGYGYSGSGYIDYEIIKNPILDNKITQFKTELEFNFIHFIMVPVNTEERDFVYKEGNIIFNNRLINVDDRELKSIITSAYLLKEDKNYVTLKRLIKTLITNKKRLRQIISFK